LNDGAAYDPATDTWRQLAPFENARARSDRTTAVWTGSRLALIGQMTPGLLIDPATGNITPLAAAESTNPNRFPTVLLDGGIVSVGDRWLDLTASTWHDTAPIPGPERHEPVAVTHDGRLYVWGGTGCPPDGACDDILVSDPGTGVIWTPPSDESAAPDEAPITSTTFNMFDALDGGGRSVEFGPQDEMTPEDLQILREIEAHFTLPEGASIGPPGPRGGESVNMLHSGLAYAAMCAWFEEVVPAVDEGRADDLPAILGALEAIRNDEGPIGLARSSIDEAAAAARRGDSAPARHDLTVNCD